MNNGVFVDKKYGISIPLDYLADERPATAYPSGDRVNRQFTDEDWEIFVNLDGEELRDLALENPVCLPVIVNELLFRATDTIWNGVDAFGENPEKEYEDGKQWAKALADLASLKQ